MKFWHTNKTKVPGAKLAIGVLVIGELAILSGVAANSVEDQFAMNGSVEMRRWGAAATATIVAADFVGA